MIECPTQQHSRIVGTSMLPTKAIGAGLKEARSGSSVLRPCTAPRKHSRLRHGAGTAQGRSPQLTLKQPLLTFEARSGRGKIVS